MYDYVHPFVSSSLFIIFFTF